MSSKTQTTATKEEAKPALVPKLRFPEFLAEPAWPANQLSNLCALNKGEQLDASDKDANARYPHYNGGISPSSYTQRANREANTIIISEGGNSCGYVQFIAEPFWSGGHCYSLAAKPNVRTLCLFYALQAKQRAIMALRIGSGLPNIQKSTLGRFVVFVPPTTAEQQKIAECLSSLDELMVAQARKVDALKTHKKGLMQQLFPREGETQPRLRFPEFKGEWNDATLGDLCFNVSSGKDARDSDGAFDLYGSTGVIGKTAIASYETPHILVARVGANAGYLTMASGQFGVTDNTLVIKLKPAAKIDFIFHYLGNININKLIFGSGQPLITGSILKAQRVLVPSAAEQSKISACLSSINGLIKAESDKLEALNAHKKGLMQHLFPSAEEGEG